MAVTIKKREQAATYADIRSILGPLDDEILTTVFEIGATPGEIFQASEWVDRNHYTLPTRMRSMTERMRRVYEILDYDRFCRLDS